VEQPVIPAGRFVLRPFIPADVAWVHQVSVDPEVQRYVDLPSPYRREDAEFFVNRLAIAGWDAGLRAEFVVADAGGASRLGRVGLGLGRAGSAEVGYWVDPVWRRLGVATGAVRAICRWGFDELDLEIIEWRAEVGNVASRRVAERAGFRVEATLRQRLVHRGTRVDAWVGSRLRSERER
jgi:RimJ/RimL family protein N-acetyltransferase